MLSQMLNFFNAMLFLYVGLWPGLLAALEQERLQISAKLRRSASNKALGVQGDVKGDKRESRIAVL
jgi:F0F1-type ATP synthase membrane subunit b/b'